MKTESLLVALANVAMSIACVSSAAAHEKPTWPDEESKPAKPPSDKNPGTLLRVSSPETSRWKWDAGMHATMASTVRVPTGGELFADVSYRSGPSIRLALETRVSEVVVGSSVVDFRWYFATPSVCPVHYRAGRFDLAPCAGVSIGALSVLPSRVTNVHSAQRLWLTPQASVVGAFSILEQLAIEARVSIEVPRLRATYAFRNTVAYVVPQVIPTYGLGLRLSL
ncbi:MAG: hypothetical protein FWD69_05590 [Polyangiaceae bacterium]|nr:hypothetical protein [Polyangiaceae bacterium]